MSNVEFTHSFQSRLLSNSNSEKSSKILNLSHNWHDGDRAHVRPHLHTKTQTQKKTRTYIQRPWLGFELMSHCSKASDLTPAAVVRHQHAEYRCDRQQPQQVFELVKKITGVLIKTIGQWTRANVFLNASEEFRRPANWATLLQCLNRRADICNGLVPSF